MSVAIEITHGSVTTRGNGSLDLTISYRKSAKGNMLLLHEAERDPQSGIKKIAPAEVTPSGATNTGKKWIQTRNEYPDNAYIRLDARSTKTGGIGGFRQTRHMAYLRARSTAPLQEFATICPTDANSSRSRVYVIGRFDILTPEEVTKLGLNLSPNGSDESGMYDPLDESVVFSNEVKERGTAKAELVKVAKLTDASGKTKTIPKLGVKRRLGLPKR